MNHAPAKGDRVTVTIMARPTEVIVESFCPTNGRAQLVAGRKGLKYSAWDAGYVVYRMPGKGDKAPSRTPPGDEPAMLEAMR